jgi:hypothetical protein
MEIYDALVIEPKRKLSWELETALTADQRIELEEKRKNSPNVEILVEEISKNGYRVFVRPKSLKE